jgi:hypothetical protein
LGEISSQSRSLFKGTKKKTECLHVGTVLFVGSVFVGTEFLFDCRVGLFGTLHVGTVLFVGSVFVGTESCLIVGLDCWALELEKVWEVL